MANPFVHVELNTTDVAKAKTFYGKLFDWKMEDIPMPDFTYTIHQCRGRDRWRDHEESDARRAVVLAGLRPRG